MIQTTSADLNQHLSFGSTISPSSFCLGHHIPIDLSDSLHILLGHYIPIDEYPANYKPSTCTCLTSIERPILIISLCILSRYVYSFRDCYHQSHLSWQPTLFRESRYSFFGPQRPFLGSYIDLQLTWRTPFDTGPKQLVNYSFSAAITYSKAFLENFLRFS